MLNCVVRVATIQDIKYAADIAAEMAISIAQRKVDIKPRSVEYIAAKMKAGVAVIAINPANGEWMGFATLEVWQHQKYVANTGLIIKPRYRGLHLSHDIKFKLFNLARTLFPQAKVFSLSYNTAVIKANEEMGFKVVPYSTLLTDPLFLLGVDTWVDFIGMMRNADEEHCTHLAMVFDPAEYFVENAVHQPVFYKKVI